MFLYSLKYSFKFAIESAYNCSFVVKIVALCPFSMITIVLFQHCKDMENISLFQIFCSIFFSKILSTMKFTLFAFEPFDKFVIELNEVICVKVLNIISVIGIDIVVDTDFLAW